MNQIHQDELSVVPDNPQILGLPHTAWRPNQAAAYRTALSLHQSGGGFLITEQPTGSGKSGVATALGAHDRVTVLVGTLNLLDQYHTQYGFQVIKGRANYVCADQDKRSRWLKAGFGVPTAADCHWRDMHDCAYATDCPYLNAKAAALSSRRLAVTYSYAMLSRSVRERGGILVCDEAHSLPDEIISFGTVEISRAILNRWRLPELPFTSYGVDGRGDILNAETQIILLDWLQSCCHSLSERIRAEGELESRAHAMLERFNGYVNLITTTDDLFCEALPEFIRLRPLDCRRLTSSLFRSKKTIVMMSATIGNPAPLADELGIQAYQWESYPHPVPADKRPIYDLGMERMTHENLKNETLYRIQAQVIRAWIETLPPEWRGIILTTSYTKLARLAEVLRESFHNRTLVVQRPKDSVSEITNRFLRHRSPGDILIASIQGFGHGLDLRGDLARYCVIAGVPHANPWDRYEQLRKQRNGKFAWWNAYAAIPQAAGRVSRGELDDNGDYLLNLCALADGSATTRLARSYYPAWFNEAIMPLK